MSDSRLRRVGQRIGTVDGGVVGQGSVDASSDRVRSVEDREGGSDGDRSGWILQVPVPRSMSAERTFEP